jgi:hypothetical protein
MSALAQYRTPPQPLVDADKFHAQGFITARGVMDVGLLESLLAEIDGLFVIQLRRRGLAGTPGGTREAFHANAQALLRADPPAYRSTSEAVRRLSSAEEIMLSQPVERIVGELGLNAPVTAGPLAAHIVSNGLDVPGLASPAHQDARGRPAGAGGLTIWIPLTPVSVRSHPLEVSPRSHLLGLLPVDAAGALDDPRIGEETFVPLPMQPGDVVVLSNLVAHRTGRRGDGSVRVAISAQF